MSLLRHVKLNRVMSKECGVKGKSEKLALLRM